MPRLSLVIPPALGPTGFRCWAVALAVALHLSSFPVLAAPLPNIVIIYADDLGFGDLSSYNPDAAYQTPRLDQMAAEGIRFTDAHSHSTICSP